MIGSHYNCGCILAINTLKMVTCVAETCRWLLYNKLTFIHSGVFVDTFKNLKHKFSIPPAGLLHTQRVPGSWGPQISRHSAHEGGKVVIRTHRPPLPPSKYSWYSFLKRLNRLQCDSAAGNIMSIKKIQWHHQESNPRPFG